MLTLFQSKQQERLFSGVLKGLGTVGYASDLIVRSYRISDWFEPDLPERVVPAAVFGRTPFSYDHACFAVLLSNGKHGRDLVEDYRALGAPFALEVGKDKVTHWVVGADRGATVPRGQFGLHELHGVFEEQATLWSPDSVLRAKNITFDLGPRQLDFIDLGLMEALESHVRQKLDRLLREVLQTAHKALRKRSRRAIDPQAIFRLVFRFLAAKVLHDRGVVSFGSLPTDQIDTVLDRVARHYGDLPPTVEDRETKEAIASLLWNGPDFNNLSVEVLAYIYENTLVDEIVRKKLGTHSTPSPIARYIVRRLPFEDFAEDDRRVLEPCSGHGIFLVAALQRLRELLPADFDEKARHRYFVKMLEGYEIDAFALEISRLCLVLADFPNPNGWKLHQEDVFQSQRMLQQLRSARIVLCNPPFEDFDEAARHKYGESISVHKPVEVIRRVLKHAHPEAVLGFVLPRQFVDGRGYREVRNAVAQRYRDIEVVAMPDGIFQESDLETALLLARRPSKSVEQVSLTFAHVKDDCREQFLTRSEVSRREHAMRSADQLAQSVSLPLFREIWERLADNPKLGELAEIHRGVEWQPPFREEKYTSPTPKSGFKRGLLKVTERFTAYLPPDTVYLSTRPQDRRGGAFDYPWETPKLIANAARLSREKWRVAVFADYEGLLCSQNFHGIWPRNSASLEVIEAILNGPIANAFVVSREGRLHVKKTTLAQVPFPRLGSGQGEAIAELVAKLRKHLTEVNDQLDFGQPGRWEQKASELLLAVDAAVLRAYDLPPRLEHALLHEFSGHERRVPFPFTQFYDRDFVPHLPLWMVISPEYAKCNAAFVRQNLPQITDPALIAAFEEVE